MHGQPDAARPTGAIERWYIKAKFLCASSPLKSNQQCTIASRITCTTRGAQAYISQIRTQKLLRHEINRLGAAGKIISEQRSGTVVEWLAYRKGVQAYFVWITRHSFRHARGRNSNSDEALPLAQLEATYRRLYYCGPRSGFGLRSRLLGNIEIHSGGHSRLPGARAVPSVTEASRRTSYCLYVVELEGAHLLM
jgi:hypothetical protein